MVLGRTYKSKHSQRYLKPEELETTPSGQVTEIANGLSPDCVWEKMSKSKYNGVNPESIQSKYGADVTRLTILFKAPPAHELEWEENDLEGQSRWLARVWNLVLAEPHVTKEESVEPVISETELNLGIQSAIAQVTKAMFETHSFNVAIAELMKLSNQLTEFRRSRGDSGDHQVFRFGIEALVTMLAPLAPHNAAEMFQTLQEQRQVMGLDTVHEQPWPEVDEQVLARAKVPVMIQVRGRTRAQVMVCPEEQQDDLRLEALAKKAVQKHLGDKVIRKVIVVRSKQRGKHHLVNFVI